MKHLRRLGVYAGITVLAIVCLAWLYSLLLGYDVVADVDPTRASLASVNGHPLGTDHMGRDVLMRLLTASEAFVGPGLLACLVAVVGGVPAGALAGYLGGFWAHALRYVFTTVASLPRFVLVLLVCAIYGDDSVILAIAAGAAYAPGLGEAVYGRIEALRNAEFVLAAKAHGLSDLSILGRHLLWVNCRKLVGRHLLYLFGYYLLLETTLSYIGGFGVEEPAPSWGNMLAFEFGVYDGNKWAFLAPAIAIWITILAAVLAADGLAEERHG